MTRSQLINLIINSNKYKTYLEIGVNTSAQPGYNWKNIDINLKHGVDPTVNTTFKMTSDEFFKNHISQKYDLIFIDGLHLFEQVYRDIVNSLKWLSKNGTIIVHDCNPLKEITQRRDRVSDVWHGDVWKAILKLRTEEQNVTIYTVDTDEGCAVIKKGKQKLLKTNTSKAKLYSFDFFNKHRTEILNLITVLDLKKNFRKHFSQRRHMKIGLLLIATGKYISFVEQFRVSVNRFFLRDKNYEVTIFVFTDCDKVPPGIVKLHKEHKDFPHPTLTRYHSFCEHAKELSSMDYLFYCDVDMKFVDLVGEEILGRTVGTIHPGYYSFTANKFPFERNPQSKSYVPVNRSKHYFCGGFNGGTTKEFLKMAKVIRQNVDADLKKNIIAKHHDESHLNKYFIDHPPEVILSPSYCYPEGEKLPFKQKLVALNKQHALVRYNGLSMITNLIKDTAFGYLIHRPIISLKKIFFSDTYV